MRLHGWMMMAVSGVCLTACMQAPAQVENRGEIFYGDRQLAALYEKINASAAYARQKTWEEEKQTRSAMVVSEEEDASESKPVLANVNSHSVRVAELQPVTVSNTPAPRVAQPVHAAAPAPKPAPFASAKTPVATNTTMHIVKPGETLFRISKDYNVPVDAIVQANQISDVTTVKAGHGLRIPSSNGTVVATASDVAPAAPITKPATQKIAYSKPLEQVSPKAPQPTVQQTAFIWPVKGPVVAQFGRQSGGLYNDGINIEAPHGTAVKAAAGGQVVYAGNELQGYGNLIILRHDNGWLTAYAHNDSLLVKRGQAVAQGQSIAKVGSSGKVDKPQLHFGVREGKEARNPLDILEGGKGVTLAAVR